MVNLSTTETIRGSDHHLEEEKVSNVSAASTMIKPIVIRNGLHPGKGTCLFCMQSATMRWAATENFAKVDGIEFPVNAGGENVRGTF